MPTVCIFTIDRYMQGSACISCASSLAHLTSVTEAVGLESNQPTLAAGRCGSLCLQVSGLQNLRLLPSRRLLSAACLSAFIIFSTLMSSHQVTTSCIIALRSLQSPLQQQQQQQPHVCWSAPQGHAIVLASFAGPVLSLVLSHSGSNTVMLLNFSDSASPPKIAASFPCQQSAAMRCMSSSDTGSCIVAVATYVQNELHVWQAGISGGSVEKLLCTRLPELLSKEFSRSDAAADADSIINCIWMQRHVAHDASSAGIDVFLGSRSGMLHQLFCDTVIRATRLVNSWRLSDSPLEFVFVGGSQTRRDELLVVGEGQWLIELDQQPGQQHVQPVVAAYQTFEGACNACTFRSPSTSHGVIVSLRPLPKPFHSFPGSDVGGAIIMTLPAVERGAAHVCKATTLSQINIDAACSHIAVLPRLSLTIVGALIRDRHFVNRASLLFISQGRVVHARPLITEGNGGAFVSLDAREDEADVGGFTIVFSLVGGQPDAKFNVSRGDFTMFECSADASWHARGHAEGHALQGGMTAVGGMGGAICILRARMKTKIEEEEQFFGGSVRPAAAKFKLWIAFEEPFYQRCTRDEQMQGAGMLSLAGAGAALGGGYVVVASVSGKARAYSQDNATIEVFALVGM